MTDYLRSGATITDVQFVRGILALRRPMRRGLGGYYSVTINELADMFEIHPNRIRSKLRRTTKRGLTEGCECGCRGDVTLTPKGEELAIMAPADEPVALPISVSVTIGDRVYSNQTVGDPHDTGTALDLARSVVKALLGHGGEQPEGLQLALFIGPDVEGLFR